MKNSLSSIKCVAPLLLFVQLFDIILHVAINQVEPLRITSNLLIVQFIIPAYMGWYKGYFLSAAYWLIGGYVVLNLIFIALNGLTNPEQGDAPRSMLFILVIVTVGLSTMFVRRFPKQDA